MPAISSDKSLIDTYFQHVNYYTNIYGEKTIVLMQVGAFFEMYGLIKYDKNNNRYIENISVEQAANACNLKLSEKVADKYVMAGRRDYQLEEFIDQLNTNGFTVAVYEQDKIDKRNDRVFVGIFSPGTSLIQKNNNVISNNITCINFFNVNYNKTKLNIRNKIIFGMSSIDNITGSCNIAEYSEEYFHDPSTYDEIEKYCSIYNPSELFIIYNSSLISEQTIKEIIQFINLEKVLIRYVDICDDKIENQNTNKHISYNDKYTFDYRAKQCSQDVYKYSIIENIYKDNSKNITNLLDLLKYNEIASQSFCFLLDYITSHNPHLVDKIQEPFIHNPDDKLLLANHSLKQLNFLDNNINIHDSFGVTKKLTSVISFLNNTKTAMGRRKLNMELTTPLTCSKILNTRYKLTEYIINKYEKFEPIRNILKTYCDLEKLYRSIVLSKILPSQIYDLIEDLDKTNQIYTKLNKSNNKILTILNKSNEYEEVFDNIDDHLNLLFNHLRMTINVDINDKSNINNFTTHFFIKGIYPDLDEKYCNYLETFDKINSITLYLTNLIKQKEKTIKQGNYCQLTETEKTGFYIKITEPRYKRLTDAINKLDTDKVELEYTSSYDNLVKKFDLKIIEITKEKRNTNIILVSKQINKMLDNINIYKEIFKNELIETYNNFLLELKTMKEYFKTIIDYIICLDNYITRAYNAINYNYCKPKIDTSSETSYFEAKEMRHILIEQFQSSNEYIPNDIHLGKKGQKGILLYGTNAVGKSSLIKSIGICVILAQCGMFVPCSYFKYSPYNTIYTRILGNDNIFKGLSTFAVEMSELRTILKGSNSKSLVLGDELCSGTELGSALSIFASGIIELNNKDSNYIFATHFHEINNLKEINELENLKLKHMSVVYDKEKDKLIYNRILKDGPGNNMYGLEVCKSLRMPIQFLDRACNIRNKIYEDTNSITMFKKSRYNSKKLIGFCEICKKKAKEIHHIKEQKNADKNGFIGSIHKNHLSNLMSLCEECHDKIHEK